MTMAFAGQSMAQREQPMHFIRSAYCLPLDPGATVTSLATGYLIVDGLLVKFAITSLSKLNLVLPTSSEFFKAYVSFFTALFIYDYYALCARNAGVVRREYYWYIS